jgi:DNA-directed RNA polymerase specialized sigma24 family protein
MSKDLTPEQRMIVAQAHYVLGISQEHLAFILQVNQGRINEACLAIRKAANNPKAVRKYKEQP